MAQHSAASTTHRFDGRAVRTRARCFVHGCARARWWFAKTFTDDAYMFVCARAHHLKCTNYVNTRAQFWARREFVARARAPLRKIGREDSCTERAAHAFQVFSCVCVLFVSASCIFTVCLSAHVCYTVCIMLYTYGYAEKDAAVRKAIV